MQLKSGRDGGFTCMTFGKCPYYMFQNRCPFLYNRSALLLSFFSIAQSHRLNLVLSWNLISRTIFTFYDLIASYYIKGKWQWRQGYLFCFESNYFDKKMFLYIFSPFDLKSLVNQKFSIFKAKFCFCDWQINVSIFSNVIGLQLPPNK